MLHNLKVRLDSRRNESGAALIAAILVMVILMSTVIFMTAIGLRGLEKGSAIQSALAALNAADSAVANALVVANSEANMDGSKLAARTGSGRAAYGSHQANAINPETGDGMYSWRWYVEPRYDQVAGTVYDVYATGFKENPDEQEARTVLATIQASVIEGMEYDPSGEIVVQETRSGSSSVAATGTHSMNLLGTAKALQYDSRTSLNYPTTSSIRSMVSSNEPVQMTGPGADIMIRGARYTASEEACVGSACGHEDIKVYHRPNMASLKPSLDEANTSCPAAASTYPDWRASTAGGVIEYTPGVKCYRNIIFDVDTRLSGLYSTGNPALVYAKGDVTVMPGVEVAKQAQRAQGPYALQIIGAATGSAFTVQAGTTANPTKYTGIFVGPNMTCDIGGSAAPSTHGTSVYGAVACRSTTVRSGSTLWWDSQLRNSARDESETSKRIWEIQVSQEV